MVRIDQPQTWEWLNLSDSGNYWREANHLSSVRVSEQHCAKSEGMYLCPTIQSYLGLGWFVFP